MIKHYKAIEGEFGRSELVFRLSDLSVISAYENRLTENLREYHMVIDGQPFYPFILTDTEHQELIEDMKSEDSPQEAGRAAWLHNPDTVTRHSYNPEKDCYVDINGEPVL